MAHRCSPILVFLCTIRQMVGESAAYDVTRELQWFSHVRMSANRNRCFRDLWQDFNEGVSAGSQEANTIATRCRFVPARSRNASRRRLVAVNLEFSSLGR